MSSNDQKKYDVFLSYAGPDEELARNIKKVFDNLGYRAYFAPKSQYQQGEGGTLWREKVVEAIRRSRSIMPIYTRYSIRRDWVLFELGAAQAAKLKVFAARVEGVPLSDLPGRDTSVYQLFDRENLIELFAGVCLLRDNNGGKRERRNELKKTLRRSTLIKKIERMAERRWVFVAGSMPEGIRNNPEILKWLASGGEFEKRIKKFVPNLTQALLSKGFSISASPQVEHVGEVVAKESASWLWDNRHAPNEYKIAGIYPVDRMYREDKNISDDFKSQWLKYLMDFRKSYLVGHDWLVVLGGNAGSKEEIDAAGELKVKIYPIPCFGGSAHQLWEDHKDLRRGPCEKCGTMDGKCDFGTIGKIVDFMKGTA